MHGLIAWFSLRISRLRGEAGASPEDSADLSRQVNKLDVVEFLRQTHGIRGALAEFEVDESECVVTFKGPGYAADAFIDRDAGRYTLTQSFHGVIAVLNDLHKGRDTGLAWSILIDASAIVLTFISLTGLVLLLYLKLRRIPGLVVAIIGTIIVLALFLLGVP
ncbi:MAG: PepSY-associated TM helix domain-containing protein [Isosphaeraceae bacterium]